MEDLQKKREKLIKKKRRDRFQWMKDSWRWKSDKKDQRTKRDLAIHSFSSPGTYHRFIIIQRVLGLRGPLRVRPLVAIVVVVPKIPSSLLSPTPPFIHCFQIKQPLQPNLVQFQIKHALRALPCHCLKKMCLFQILVEIFHHCMVFPSCH